MSAEGFEFDEYIERARTGPCFVCRLVAGDPDYHHEVVFEDEDHIAFLDRYPTVAGYVLVCPKAHRKLVTGDFDAASFLALQKVIYRVGEAIRLVLRVHAMLVRA